MIKIFSLLLVALVLSACSSGINSIKNSSGTVDGLVYFMPKKDFLVTITVTNGEPTNVVLGTTAAYPDLSQQYTLTYEKNLFGKNTLNVNVSKTGLLSSTTSATESNVTDVFKNLAKAAGTLLPFGGRSREPNGNGEVEQKCQDGVHSFIYDKVSEKIDPPPCNVTITIKQVISSISCLTENEGCSPASKNVFANEKKANEEYSGIFYRRSEPYLMTAQAPDRKDKDLAEKAKDLAEKAKAPAEKAKAPAEKAKAPAEKAKAPAEKAKATDGNLTVAAIVFSPSYSATHFLPISKTFFSNNKAEFTFVNGMLTGYKQETESEATKLFDLPADILSSYFSAIGAIFESFKSADTNEISALTESLKLELEKKKYDACIAAIKAEDDELIKRLSC